MASKIIIKLSLISLYLITTTVAHAELRDPTKPARFVYTETKSEPAGALKLTSIWIAKSSKRATINGITAKQGQTILNGIKIIQIHPKLVIVSHNGQNKTLRLLQDTVKNFKLKTP